MRFEKIAGKFLLIFGIFLIIYPLYFSYNIFTGKSQAPEVFKAEERKKIPPLQKTKGTLSPAEFQKEVEKMVEEKIIEILLADFLPKFLNLISWSIFVSILIFAGAKISTIGIQLIRR